MNRNFENPGVGAAFQKAVALWFEQEYDKEFILEKKIAITTQTICEPKARLIKYIGDLYENS